MKPSAKPYCDWGSCMVPPPYYPSKPGCLAVLLKWANLGFVNKPQMIYDKFLHCMAGCEIATSCGDFINAAAAASKEKMDPWVGGEPSVEDALATMDGGDCKNAPGGCDCCCIKKGYKPIL